MKNIIFPPQNNVFVTENQKNYCESFPINENLGVETKNSSLKLDGFKYANDKINSKGKNILMPQTSDLFERFLEYTHKIELIKDFIIEFKKFDSWIKNFRPTQTFINFIKEKKTY
ncbi:MAG: hypothetical protein ACTSRI_07470 [Promethearchaeota archaeon]